MKLSQYLVRVLRVSVAAVMAVTLTLGVSACGGSSDEQLIRSSVTEILEVFKNPTKENLAPYLGDSEESFKELETYGIDVYDFLQHAFSKYDYQVGDISVDGDTATAAVNVTNADLTAAINAVAQDYASRSDEIAETYANGGEDALKTFMQDYFNAVYEQIDKSDGTVSSDVTLKLSKKDGKWDVDEDSTQDLIYAMYGGLDLGSLG